MLFKNSSHSSTNMRNTKIFFVYVSAHKYIKFNAANLISQAKTLMQNLNQAFPKHHNLVDLKNPKSDGGGEGKSQKARETV